MIPDAFTEVWADVKAPGDGRQYSLGTIELNYAQGPAQFSEEVFSRPGNLDFFLALGQKRQVAMLQVTSALDQRIQWQAAFYGKPRVGTDSLRATNARGIAVWTDAVVSDRRVVICGETYDETLPLDSGPGWQLSTGSNASGFIAIYDGTGQLRWHHQLFGNSVAGDCAVTDVSLRVEYENGVPVRDVITYCGISSHGNPNAGTPNNNSTLSTVRPFVAPGALCATSAAGDTDNGVRQWDGFVGRIVRDHAGQGPVATRFHSVVGGNQQDGLFGIAEMPDDRFVVVGSTASAGVVTGPHTPPLGVPMGGPNPGFTGTFPLTTGTCLPSAPQGQGYCLGTLLVFDASATTNPSSPNDRLVLVRSIELGSQGPSSTIAADVIARRYESANGIGDAMFVVGSTDQAGLVEGFIPSAPAEPYGGARDGYLLEFHDSSAGLQPFWGSYRGGPRDDGLTGVAAWNEFSDHVVVCGFREREVIPDPPDPEGPGVLLDVDIDVASYYAYSNGYTSPPLGWQLRLLRGLQIGGSSPDLPTAMGTFEVTKTPLRFHTFGLGAGGPAGGGVAQDRNGRVNVVGTTFSRSGANSTGYPVFPLASPTVTHPVLLGRVRSQSQPSDGVRTVLDLLPDGVGRTDGTGPAALAFALANVLVPPAGTDGGTTPPCARLDFGAQLGMPPPPLPRMLIDYEGGAPGQGVVGNVVVMRPPTTLGWLLAALQVSLPGASGTNLPWVMSSGMEAWTIVNPHTELFYLPPAYASYRSNDILFPAGPFACTVQVAFGLSVSIPAGNPAAGMPCAGTTDIAASPALFVNY